MSDQSTRFTKDDLQALQWIDQRQQLEAQQQAAQAIQPEPVPLIAEYTTLAVPCPFL